MSVLVEHRSMVTIVTVNRPEKLNALSSSVFDAIAEAIEQIRGRGQTRCVIVTGAGKAFVAGADIAEIADFDSVAATQYSLRAKQVFNSIENFDCPVIAAVGGFALGGGCELALACDFMIASDRAKFGMPEVTLGVTPGFGGMQRMAARVGAGIAREILYSGRMIAADEALRIGLVNRVVASEQLMAVCLKLADQIAAAGPRSVACVKQTLAGHAGGLSADDDQKDSEAFGALFGSADQREGMRAFVEKRPAVFSGE